jgi:cell division protein FtsA
MTGIVLTGGGSQLRNLKQMVAYITGKETRIGYPNEHLSSESKDIVVSPMYSTGVGLVLKGFEHSKKESTNIIEQDENSQNISGGIIDKLKEWFTEEETN